MRRKNKKEVECKHSFVKFPPKVGKLKVCTKCGFLWVLGDVKFGERTIKLSGSGNYIETSTTTAPASPASGKIRLYATSGTSLRMKDSTGTETDLAAGGTLYNFLTNPGFEIWQRGAGAFSANTAYTADRWYIQLDGSTGSVSVTRSGIGETDTVRDTGSKYALKAVYTHVAGVDPRLILQKVELDGAHQWQSRQVTISIRVRTATASAVKVYIQDDVAAATLSGFHTGGGTFETLTATVTVDAAATFLLVGIKTFASATAYLDNATLVIGSTAQTYYPLHPAEEWERCQRYYYLIGGPADSANYVPAMYAYCEATGNTTVNLPFPAHLPAAPSVTKTGTWNAAGVGAQPTIHGYNRDMVTLLGTPTGAGTFIAYPNTNDDGVTVEANP